MGKELISKVEGIVRNVQKDRRILPRPALCWWVLLWSLAQPLERRVAEWKDPSVNGDVYFYGSFMNISNRMYIAIYTVYSIQ